MKLDSHPEAELDRLPLRTKVHQVLDGLRMQISERSYCIFYMHWIEGRTMADMLPFWSYLLNKSGRAIAARTASSDRFSIWTSIDARRRIENEVGSPRRRTSGWRAAQG
jgi:hypothetical protein